MLVVCALCITSAFAQSNKIALLTAQTTTTSACSASRAVTASAWKSARTFFATGTTSAGAGAATVVIYGSNDGVSWTSLGTITLTLATTITADTNTGGFASLAPWPFVCAHVSAISGTSASVTVTGAME